jgi:hypothetical protein
MAEGRQANQQNRSWNGDYIKNLGKGKLKSTIAGNFGTGAHCP